MPDLYIQIWLVQITGSYDLQYGVINMIWNAVLGLAGDVVSGVVNKQKAKAERKLVEIQAETEIKKNKYQANWILTYKHSNLVRTRGRMKRGQLCLQF